MPKHHSTQVNIPGLFDAGDMLDAHHLAACDLRWMELALNHVKSTLKNIADSNAKSSPLISAEITNLANHVEMYGYLVDHRSHVHEQLVEEYKELFEKHPVGEANV